MRELIFSFYAFISRENFRSLTRRRRNYVKLGQKRKFASKLVVELYKLLESLVQVITGVPSANFKRVDFLIDEAENSR